VIRAVTGAGELLEAVAWAAAFGLVLIAAYSFAIWGAIRFVDLNRNGRGAAATVAGVAVAVGLALSIAAVVAGLILMATK
jgi:hypothetical protein